MSPGDRPRRPTQPGPWDDLPDVRDGLTRRERIVLWALRAAEHERGGRSVPTAQLYGRVVEYVDMSEAELNRILVRFGARDSKID